MVANASRGRPCPGTEASGEDQPARFGLAAVDGGGHAPRCGDPGLLGVPRGETGAIPSSIGVKHQPAGIPPAAAIGASQGGRGALGRKDTGLLGVPGVQAVRRRGCFCLNLWKRHKVYRQPRLGLQRHLQLGRQGLAPLTGSAQDTQAGFPAQIIFAGR